MSQEERAEKYRRHLVEMVKASGQDVIDRAEDLVGTGGEITDFDICIRFPQPFDSLPTIEVTRSHVAKNVYDALMFYEKNSR